MATDIRDQKVTSAPTTTPPNTVPLEKVADAVRRDSQREPERYLDETITKHGGE